MANVKFFQSTLANFNTKKAASGLVAGGLYFITDAANPTIFRATATNEATEYGNKVKVVSAFPGDDDTKLQGVLYISGSTGKTWNGSAWVTAFEPAGTIDSAITTSGDNANTASTNAVSTAAVYNYINSLKAANTGASTDSGLFPVLGSDGKLNSAVIPSIAINTYVGSKSSVAALKEITGAEQGDWATVSGSSTATDDGAYILTSDANGADATWVKMTASTYDATVIENSTNAVQGGAVYTALAGKVNVPSGSTEGYVLTVDSTGNAASYQAIPSLAWEEVTTE